MIRRLLVSVIFALVVTTGYCQVPMTGGGLGSPAPAGFNPASLFPADGGYWNVALSVADGTIYQDTAGSTVADTDGESVCRIDDRSGNGNNLVQATGTKCPILRSGTNCGTTAAWCLVFDGVDDYLQATFTIGLPFTRINAAAQFDWGLNDRVWDGVSPSSGGVALVQNSVSPSINFNGALSNAMTLSTNHVVTEIGNISGNTNNLAVDNESYHTSVSNLSTFLGTTIGSTRSGTTATNLRWFGAIWIAGIMSDPNIASCRTFFAALYEGVL